MINNTLRKEFANPRIKNPGPKKQKQSVLERNNKTIVLEKTAKSEFCPSKSLRSMKSISSDDKELYEIQNASRLLNRELLSKIKNFKQENSVYLQKKKETCKKIKTQRLEIEQIKGSLYEIMQDTEYTKHEIKEMRERLEEETFKEFVPMSPYGSDFVYHQLVDLKNEIEFMNNKLSYTEENIKIEINESSKLKNDIFRLKERIFDKKFTERKKSECKTCVVL